MHYFLLYNDNTHVEDIKKLIESIKKYGKHFEIIVFDKNRIHPEFVSKNYKTLSLKRGGGYWLWKPYIISCILEKIKEKDILFYLDSKYYFTENFEKLYSNHIESNDLLVWKNKPNGETYYMKNWCKMDVIKKYNMYEKVFLENAEDFWAGAIVIKKTENTIKYMKEWLEMCCVHEDITDSPSVTPNSELFNEHRHDQSLLSIVLHKYNIPTVYFEKKYLQNVRYPY